MPHLNIEIKACCEDAARARELLDSRNAEFRGEDHQTDTYFVCPNGRLKLREGDIENSLIFYDRENAFGPRDSHVSLLRTGPGEVPAALKEILSNALGVLVTVEKTREIYFIGNVKFHIDTVRGLGTFVEIEAIDETGTIGREELMRQCSEYIELLGITQKDMLDCSYSDMVLELEA